MRLLSAKPMPFLAALASLLIALPSAPAGAQGAPASTPLATALFASVNGTPISAAEYDQNAREAFRSKFYHGKPPEAEVNNMLREVGQALIDRQLLVATVRERDIPADSAAVAAELARVDQRFQANPGWAEARERELPAIKAQIELRQRVATLEKQVRAAAPTIEEAQAFYARKPELFTQPARTRASLILIRVDPSAGAAAWDVAREKLAGLRARILAGADFAALAREHSADATAPSGGDLGYVHSGMIAAEAEVALKELKIGELTEPLRVLEGEALFRLDGREPSNLQPFDLVAERARKLLADEMSEAQWKAFLAKLRAQANIIVDPAFQKIMSTPPAATGQ